MTEIFENIKSLYQFEQPCLELHDFIEFFSESVSDRSIVKPFTIKMFPSWTPTIWINMGASYRLKNGQKNHHIGANDHILLLRDTIVERINFPADHIFTIKFNPGGLEAVTGISQSTLIGRLINIQQILPAYLIGAVKNANSFQERVLLLETYFLNSLHLQRKKNHCLKLVQDTIGHYQSSSLQLNNNQLAAKIFVTSKTINRYFNKVVGLSPKNYLSILRSRQALTAFKIDKKHFLAENFGYHDRSHFYRDIAKFTGQRLSDFYLK